MTAPPIYHDVQEIRPGLFLGSRPPDLSALVGRFEAVLDLRLDPCGLSETEVQQLGLAYRHFPMEDGVLPDPAQGSLDDLVLWLRCRLKEGRRRVLVHCDAGASRSATVVALYLIRQEALGADEAVLALRALRPIVQPHGVYLTFLRQASGESAPASAFAYLLGRPDDAVPAGAPKDASGGAGHTRSADEQIRSVDDSISGG